MIYVVVLSRSFYSSIKTLRISKGFFWPAVSAAEIRLIRLTFPIGTPLPTGTSVSFIFGDHRESCYCLLDSRTLLHLACRRNQLRTSPSSIKSVFHWYGARPSWWRAFPVAKDLGVRSFKDTHDAQVAKQDHSRIFRGVFLVGYPPQERPFFGFCPSLTDSDVIESAKPRTGASSSDVPQLTLDVL